MNKERDLVALAREWSAQLPRPFARRLADALRAGPFALQALQAIAVQPASAAVLRTALAIAYGGDGGYLAGLIVGHLHADENQAVITPVWTGPASATRHGRLTLAALSDLIAEAEQEIVLVSYATLPSAKIRGALLEATARGVALTLLFERPSDNPAFRGHDNPLPDLAATRLHWPAAAREHHASMHAKLLVVDRHTALVGSANLTDHGLERNLECGLLIRGGRIPAMLVEHLLTAEGLRHADI